MSQRSAPVVLSALVVLTLMGCQISMSDAMGTDGGFGICDGPKGNIESVYLNSVEGGNLLQLGDSVTITGDVRDGTCSAVVIDLMNNWTTSAPSVLSVRPLAPAGLQAVLGSRDLGRADVTLSAGARTTTASFGVIRRIASLNVSPVSASISVGDSVLVSVTATDTSGHVLTSPSFTYTIDTSGATEMRARQGSGFWLVGLRPGTSTTPVRYFAFQTSVVVTVVAR